jgi:threonine dehydrogenase-like Zn-dependent dehydrogenase
VLAGASLIIGVDPLQKRREVARTLGAGICLDPLRCDAGMEIKKSTGNRGADVCVDFSGNRQALQQAIRGVAYGGSVVYGAYPGPFDAGLDLGAEAHINAVNLVFSRACSEPNRDHPSWTTERIRDTCYQLIMEGKINGEQIVTPVLPFDELIDVYPKIATDPGSMIKLGVRHY